MKHLARIAVTGIMALTLSACGGNDAPAPPDTNANDLIQQVQQPAQDVQPAAPAPSEAVIAAPEAPNPVDADTTDSPTEPTAAQVQGATAEE